MKVLNNFHLIKEDTTAVDIARIMPIISASLEKLKVDHQTSMVEIEGMLKYKPISILNDPGASLTYLSLRIVELYISYKKISSKNLG